MFIFPSGIPSGASGYQPAGALMADGSADYFTWTPSAAGSTTIATVSCWVKRNKIDVQQYILFAGRNSTPAEGFTVAFDANNKLNFAIHNGSAYVLQKISTAVYRDPTAWLHILALYNTATGANNFYVNGVEITAWDTNTNASSSEAIYLHSAQIHRALAGSSGGSLAFYNSTYVADLITLDGVRGSLSDFGETDSDTGIWVPKDPSDISSFGNNGFWLGFDDGNNLGKDKRYDNPTYAPTAVDFDGSAAYLLRGSALTGAADGKQITVSAWVTVDALSGEMQIFSTTSGYVKFSLSAAGRFELHGWSPSTSQVLLIQSNTVYAANPGNWMHVIASANLATGAGKMYINGADDTKSGATLTDSNIDLDRANWGVGSTTSGTAKWNGGMSNVMYDDTYVDLTDAATLAKFIDTDGNPVNPGSDGSTAFAASPLIVLNNATATWHTNTGTGGGMTKSGALIDYVTPVRSVKANDSAPTSMGANNIVAGGPANSTTKEVTIRCSLDSNMASDITLSGNNLTAIGAGSSNWGQLEGTVAIAAGTKGYYEVTISGTGTSNVIGWGETGGRSGTGSQSFAEGDTIGYQPGSDVLYTGTGTTSTWTGYTAAANDILMFAYDATSMTAVKFWVGINGTWRQSGDPAAGSNAAVTYNCTAGTIRAGAWVPLVALHTITDTFRFSSDSWAYSAPTGFSELTATVTGTGNAATFNNLLKSTGTFSNGNLTFLADSQSGFGHSITSTHTMASGTYYAEFVVDSWSGTNHATIGIATTEFVSSGNYAANWTGANTQSWGYYADGSVYTNGSATSSGYTSYTLGDVIGVKLDATNGAVYFYKNGVVQNSGSAAYSSLTGPFVFSVSNAGGSTHTTITANFGQKPFIFQPSSTSALATQNLPEPTVTDPSAYFQAVTWTGDGTAIGSGGKTITFGGNSDLVPDLVWVKRRNEARAHQLYNSVIGWAKANYSNLTDAVGDVSEGVTAVTSDGFTVGNNGGVNESSDTYVAWCWKAGGAPTATNSAGAGATPTANSVKIDGSNLGSALAGTIPATKLSANTTAGFSIVTWTGTDSTGTVAHGLGVAPKMIWAKRTSGSDDWVVYHIGVDASSPEDYYLKLSSSAARTDDTMWNDDKPDATTFNVYSNYSKINANNETYVAYCFAEKEGFSKFGSWTGNGESTNGPFIYCGFKPAFVMHKRSAGEIGNWVLQDVQRNPYNPVGIRLNADNDYSESTVGVQNIDILSNGFKIRNGSGGSNTSGHTYIYWTFAATPFSSNNRAR